MYLCIFFSCPSRKKFVKTKKFQKIYKDDSENEQIIKFYYLIDHFFNIVIAK